MNEVTKQQDLKQDYREEMKQTILSIAGRPGLYKLVSRGNNSLIVETLDETHTRRPAFATDRVTSLSDIAMYTDEEDIPLGTVLDRSTGVRLRLMNSRHTLAKCCPTSIAIVCTIATSRSSCSGMTSLSRLASPILSLRPRRLRARRQRKLPRRNKLRCLKFLT